MRFIMRTCRNINLEGLFLPSCEVTHAHTIQRELSLLREREHLPSSPSDGGQAFAKLRESVGAAEFLRGVEAAINAECTWLRVPPVAHRGSEVQPSPPCPPKLPGYLKFELSLVAKVSLVI